MPGNFPELRLDIVSQFHLYIKDTDGRDGMLMNWPSLVKSVILYLKYRPPYH